MRLSTALVVVLVVVVVVQVEAAANDPNIWKPVDLVLQDEHARRTFPGAVAAVVSKKVQYVRSQAIIYV